MKGGPLSRWALRTLTRPRRVESRAVARSWDPDAVAAVLKPADVLLFEGDQRISAVISYLTTSPWSHAALYL
ncbi:MAG TPA: lipo-like protein, partial [Thermoanaerobaculia bacterium]|nr:lipo-like protein [Thermoanaerobaculia bacterium]